MPIETGSWMSFKEIVDDALERIRDISGLEINPLTAQAWASQACRDFALRSETVRASWQRPMVPSTAQYRLPSDCIRVFGVYIDYPGNDGPSELPYRREHEILNGLTNDDTGEPVCWYLDPTRAKIGLWPVPDKGGFRGFTTGAGNAGGTTLVCSSLSSTDDFYNGMTLRILDGALDGEEQTISDYDGTTGTVTVDTAFSAQVASGVRFDIAPTSLRVDYVAAGNPYLIRPTAATVQASPAPTYDTFALNLADRRLNFWAGCEVEFTAGGLIYQKARIVSSTGDSTSTTVVVEPELPAKPSSTDTVNVTDVPNIPPAWHHALVLYLVYRALRRRDQPGSDAAFSEYLDVVAQARGKDDPVQEQEYEQIRLYGRGEWEEC